MSSEVSHPASGDDQLRVLIANETPDHLTLITDVVVGLGHTVIAAGVSADEVGSATRREIPDVALVGLGASSEHALDLVTKIVHEAACPVIALLHQAEPEFVNEAAKRGIFAYIEDDDAQQLKSTL